MIDKITALYLAAYRSDADPEYQQHKAIFLNCAENDKPLPADTAFYFGSPMAPPYNHVVLDEKLEVGLEDDVHFKDYNDGHDIHGWEIDITKLPAEVVKIRFYEGLDDDFEEDEYGDGEDA